LFQWVAPAPDHRRRTPNYPLRHPAREKVSEKNKQLNSRAGQLRSPESAHASAKTGELVSPERLVAWYDEQREWTDCFHFITPNPLPKGAKGGEASVVRTWPAWTRWTVRAARLLKIGGAVRQVW